MTNKPNSQQALIDAVVAAAKQGKATAESSGDAQIIELAGRGLEAPDSISLDEIKMLCRSVIAKAVDEARRA